MGLFGGKYTNYSTISVNVCDYDKIFKIRPLRVSTGYDEENRSFYIKKIPTLIAYKCNFQVGYRYSNI